MRNHAESLEGNSGNGPVSFLNMDLGDADSDDSTFGWVMSLTKKMYAWQRLWCARDNAPPALFFFTHAMGCHHHIIRLDFGTELYRLWCEMLFFALWSLLVTVAL